MSQLLSTKRVRRILAIPVIMRFVSEELDYSMELSYEESFSGQMMYKVFFNGEATSITKTIQPLIKQANRLVQKYNLLPCPDLSAFGEDEPRAYGLIEDSMNGCGRDTFEYFLEGLDMYDRFEIEEAIEQGDIHALCDLLPKTEKI